MCASCLAGYGRTRTAKLREPSFWSEKSWSRLDRQSGVCELSYRAVGHDAVYRVKTRHRWYYEDSWYVKRSVTIYPGTEHNLLIYFLLSHCNKPASNVLLIAFCHISCRSIALSYTCQFCLSVLGRHANDAGKPQARATAG